MRPLGMSRDQMQMPTSSRVRRSSSTVGVPSPPGSGAIEATGSDIVNASETKTWGRTADVLGVARKAGM